MQYQLELSPTIVRLYPHMPQLLRETHRHAHDADADIPVEKIRVTVRVSRRDEYIAAHAYPQTSSVSGSGRNFHRHRNGRITMSVGYGCDDRLISRIFAHELRHLGQYARGRRATGRLSFGSMHRRDAERDCRVFEGVVLAAMGYDTESDPYRYRNTGRRYAPATASR